MVKNKNSEMVQHSDFLISHLSHRSATLIEILTRRWGGEWVRVGGVLSCSAPVRTGAICGTAASARAGNARCSHIIGLSAADNAVA
jgi:hypothetical protein